MIEPSTVALPELSLVVLIGPSGSGKSTFARKHFKPTEVLSSDYCRALVSDSENDQTATSDAFDVLRYVAAKRLAAGKLTVIDATSVKPEDRKPFVKLARDYHCLPAAVVFNIPEKICQERNSNRPDRVFGRHVIRSQRAALRRGLRGLRREGFRHTFVFESPEEVESATVERQPLWNDKREERGPFDIIGDVHGCYGELVELLDKLGYQEGSGNDGSPRMIPPNGRKAVFLGDLVDRGPKSPQVLHLVMNMVACGTALCVPGNHDIKLMRKLRGKNVQITHGLAETLDQLSNEPDDFRAEVADFIDSLVSHYVLDGGRLVVAHAGMKAEMQGRGSGKVREFALYGETTGETDEFGLPVRHNWAAEYRASAMVVYGHTPVPDSDWLNGTINIDTGCVFGGRLTALRYPERELISVEARSVYAEPQKPFPLAEPREDGLTTQQAHDDILDISDLVGKRIISTRLRHNVIVREENTAAALEVMSRFAANPKWIIYLPPTMSPCETSREEGLLEHPREAFAYYRQQGHPRVICQVKHMGSRAVVVVCRDDDAARKCFGVREDEVGIIYTRTGRRFFADPSHERELLQRVNRALTKINFWSELKTDWACLDCEIMPWSAKARALLEEQYAPVGAAAGTGLTLAISEMEQARAEGLKLDPLLARFRERESLAADFVRAYREYCWAVESVSDLKLAPFHILATEGRVHVDQDHRWHMDSLANVCRADGEVLLETEYRVVDLTDTASEDVATAWWEELTGRGGEGMVVKPLDFIARGPRGLVQPAVKCRGREYLRIIYGPEYTIPGHLERLRKRGLGRKRSLALREFALGVEALERFVRGEPLRRVHECVFGVLALESDPTDPRL